MSRRTIGCALALALFVGLLGPVKAAPRPAYPWLSHARHGDAILATIGAYRSKTPDEFFSRLRYARPDGTLGVIVRLVRRDPRSELFASSNTSYIHWYGDEPIFYAHVDPDEVAELLRSPLVKFVEPDYPITNFLSTAAVEVSARGGESGSGMWSFDMSPDPYGTIVSEVPGLSPAQVTGRGVVVADTDSGIDGTNRDFGGWSCSPGPYSQCESRIVRKVTINQASGGDSDEFGFPTTDLASGHGTHTAGIIAGNGFYSRTGDASPGLYGGDGYNFGLAPQASLISVKLGDSQSAALGYEALQWEADHAQKYDIRASNNSWGCSGGCSFDPQSSGALILRNLYRAGVLVTVAAGNDAGGPDGAAYNGAAQSPYVLGVAAYDDEQDPPRIASFSSRGVAGLPLPDPSSWTPESEEAGYRRPDLSAPGVSIWSAANLTGGTSSITPRPNPQDAGQETSFLPYTTMSGTSMATPMVTGAGALLMGACPQAPTLEIMRALMAGAQTKQVLDTEGDTQAPTNATGYGALNVRASYEWLRSRPSCGQSATGGDIRPVLDVPTDAVTRQKITFDASGSTDEGGSISSYQWDFGDGQTGSGSKVEHAYRKPGYYEVTLTVSEPDGALATRRRTISVSKPPVFTGEGHVQVGSYIVTSADFIFECPRTPPTQGIDGYLFELPEPLVKDNLTATIQATAEDNMIGLTTYASIWTDECDSVQIAYSEGSPRLSIDVPAGTQYIVAQIKGGSNINVTLSVHPRIPTKNPPL
ncbi:MAG: hypothetical protein QOG54_2847 [Actinomycetota bacterium]|jgi:subtilisin family serine protease|nr:hypothetical protein [Actinomycetota bacterium]